MEEKNRTIPKQLIDLVDSKGNKTQVEIIRFMPSEKEKKIYLVYTDTLDDNAENINLRIGILNEDEKGIKLDLIKDVEEYKYALSLMKNLI